MARTFVVFLRYSSTRFPISTNIPYAFSATPNCVSQFPKSTPTSLITLLDNESHYMRSHSTQKTRVHSLSSLCDPHLLRATRVERIHGEIYKNSLLEPLLSSINSERSTRILPISLPACVKISLKSPASSVQLHF